MCCEEAGEKHSSYSLLLLASSQRKAAPTQSPYDMAARYSSRANDNTVEHHQVLSIDTRGTQ
ncbi:hypothetical protein AB7M33_004397 [Pseudomonas sp. Y3 TE3536]